MMLRFLFAVGMLGFQTSSSLADDTSKMVEIASYEDRRTYLDIRSVETHGDHQSVWFEHHYLDAQSWLDDPFDHSRIRALYDCTTRTFAPAEITYLMGDKIVVSSEGPTELLLHGHRGRIECRYGTDGRALRDVLYRVLKVAQYC